MRTHFYFGYSFCTFNFIPAIIYITDVIFYAGRSARLSFTTSGDLQRFKSRAYVVVVVVFSLTAQCVGNSVGKSRLASGETLGMDAGIFLATGFAQCS